MASARRALESKAAAVFGDVRRARRWARTKLPALDGMRPIDLAFNFEQQSKIDELLNAIEHGMFS